jgi:hypothetical protein
MAIIRVIVVEWLCQVVKGQIPAFEGLLSGVRVRLWLSLVWH